MATLQASDLSFIHPVVLVCEGGEDSLKGGEGILTKTCLSPIVAMVSWPHGQQLSVSL